MEDHRRIEGLYTDVIAERDALRRENRALAERLKSVEKDLSVAQLAQGFAAGDGASEGDTKAIARVNRLIREVDQCIRLIK